MASSRPTSGRAPTEERTSAVPSPDTATARATPDPASHRLVHEHADISAGSGGGVASPQLTAVAHGDVEAGDVAQRGADSESRG